MKNIFPSIIFICVLTLTAHAQTFSSGSTGADGALDCDIPGNCTVQLPESGVLNYTTVNVCPNSVLNFKSNFRNTPVIILAQGDVNIIGDINVQYSIGGNGVGPGGFYGGKPATGEIPATPGFGPGGGTACNSDPCGGGTNGKWIGQLSLVPIIGGSGGGGGFGCHGGLGGGAIVIASSTSITINGRVVADGTFPYSTNGSCGNNGFLIGSGGAVRLISNSVNIQPGARVTAAGGFGNNGLIRIEAPAEGLKVASNTIVTPAPILSTTINPKVVPDSSTPSLTITQVGGYTVPSITAARPDAADLLLPNQLTDPISVVVQARNIPVGTRIELRSSPTATSAPGTLSGSFASSSATATISNLNRTGVTYLLATAIFDVPQGAQNANPPGKNQVERVRVEAAPGKEPKFIFLRKDGSAVETAKLPSAFLSQFGQ